MTSGIYVIWHEGTNGERSYVGSSVDVETRLAGHRSALKSGRHPNTKLQNAFNMCDGEGFVFDLVEECLPDHLSEREQYWMDSTDAFKSGYNIAVTASQRPTSVERKQQRAKVLTGMRRTLSYYFEESMRIREAQSKRNAT